MKIKINLKKIVVLVAAAAAVGGLTYQHQEINSLKHDTSVRAANIKSERLRVGTRYHIGGVSMVVSTYEYKGHKNYIIKTNLKHKAFCDVGSNDDKQGKTNGVTVAFGNDQR